MAAALTGLGVGFLAARVGPVAVFLVTFACAETLFLVALAEPARASPTATTASPA